MALGIAVVDDVAMDCERLVADIRRWFRDEHRGEATCTGFSGGAQFLGNGGLSGQYGMVFMDIRMAGMDGLETARKLRAVDPGALIVYVSSATEYALEAYPTHPYDFLVKPYAPERLDGILSDAMRTMQQKYEELEIRVAHGAVRVRVNQIVSAVAQAHAVDYLLDSGQVFRSRQSFAGATERLEQYGSFLQINRGVTINMDHAVSLSDGVVFMGHGVSYPLRIRNQAELVQRFTQYQIQQRMGGR